MWIIPPPDCSPSAPASEDSTSESSWPFRALAQSVSWRGKPRAAKSWHRAWKKDEWLQRLCGRILEPSTAQRGVEQWISSLRGTHVSRSPVQESERAERTSDTSGQRPNGSSERCSQGLLFSKTSKDTSAKDFVRSSKTSWNWGSMRSGEFTPQPKPEPPTAGTGFSCWPTHQARDYRSPDREGSGNYARKVAKGYSIDLNSRSVQWMTPTASEKAGLNPATGRGAGLSKQAKLWLAPRANNSGENPETFVRRNADRGGHCHGSIESQVKRWPTPGANDHKGSSRIGQCRGQLDEAAEQKYPLGPPAPKVTGPASQEGSGLRLNPLFVEWLMGLPIGWTDLGASGTQLSRSKLH